MPETMCSGCEVGYAYDYDLGLNVVRMDQPEEAIPQGETIVAPCCPKCNTFQVRVRPVLYADQRGELQHTGVEVIEVAGVIIGKRRIM